MKNQLLNPRSLEGKLRSFQPGASVPREEPGPSPWFSPLEVGRQQQFTAGEQGYLFMLIWNIYLFTVVCQNH